MFPDRHGAVSLDLDRAYVFPVSENKGEVGNRTVEIGGICRDYLVLWA